LDREIEARAGKTVTGIFAGQGEAAFRSLESRVLQEIIIRRELVLAVGGGTVLDPQNMEILARSTKLVLLEAAVESLVERIGNDTSRPLLQNINPGEDCRSSIEKLLKERAAAYRKIGFSVDTTDITPMRAACKIAARLDLSFRSISLPVLEGAFRPHPGDDERGGAPKQTVIEIGRGLLSRIGERLKTYGLDTRVFLFIPSKVRDPHLHQIAASLDLAGIPWKEIAVQDGDQSKNMEQVSALLARLTELGAARDHVAVAVGGGVTGDLAGLAASLYMRGMALVQVPTTLLAQVDAAIGGKTGVNLPLGKNLAGTFYPPRLVLSDPCVLRTLSEAEISNGMAEVVKTALLGAPGLFDTLERAIDRDPAVVLKSIDLLEKCAGICAEVKAAIVARDPFEKGERKCSTWATRWDMPLKRPEVTPGSPTGKPWPSAWRLRCALP
ncbi:MAG: bifunctional shikimate kinase/3-dehydroquinate synthase, partial [Planctomycetes bacterium]|nr:bifunctional shikimate kinase/3-dehydroquinate synthase [Planctomycetota bacterium]